MPKPKTVSGLMAQGVVIAHRDHTADYVKRQMKTLDIHAVPVADEEGRPIGIVRWRDLLGVADDARVGDIASPHVLTAETDTPIPSAARVMRAQSRRQLVVTDRGRIVGILSAFDFLRLVEDEPTTTGQDDTREHFKTGIFKAQSPEPS